MGARIEAVATARSRARPLGGALHVSDVAARACLARAHRNADDLDLLVNAGLYKDFNAAEPALASIIQEDIGANPGHPPRAGHHGTFSFDVMNGGCGVLTAAQLVDGFVRPGTARLGMIVAGDAVPAPRASHGFRFPPVGGAILLAHDAGAGGFERFAFRTFPEDAELFVVELGWEAGQGRMRRRGKNMLDVREDPRFGPACVKHATRVVKQFLADDGLSADDVDLVIGSQYPAHFADDVAAAVGIAADKVPVVDERLASSHTAGPIAALDAAIASGAFARARHVLFVTCGAGITIGVARYRPTPRAAA